MIESRDVDRGWRRRIGLSIIAALVLGDLGVSVVGIVLGATKLDESSLATWALIAGIANVCQLCFVGIFAAMRDQRYWRCGCSFLAFVTAIFFFLLLYVGFWEILRNGSSPDLVRVSICLDVACSCWVVVYMVGCSHVVTK